MAYNKTLWKDRVVERPNTYRTVENTDGTITLYPATGQVIEKGTPVSATNLNKLENGIVEVYKELDAKIDGVANKGTTVEVIERVTKQEIDRQIADGTMANLTIADESIEGKKLGSKTITGEKLKDKCINSKHLATDLSNTIATIEGVVSTVEGMVDITSKFKFDINGQIIGNTSGNYGTVVSSTNFTCCDFVDIKGASKLKIVVPIRVYSPTAFTGLCFYDANKKAINGYYFTDNSASTGYTMMKTIEVPPKAVYVRTTLYSEGSTWGTNTVNFSCGIVSAGGLKAKVDAIEENITKIESDIYAINEKIENIGTGGGTGGGETGGNNITSKFKFDINGQIIGRADFGGYGDVVSSTNLVCCDFVEIRGASVLKIVMLVRKYVATAGTGLCFYDSNKKVIEGHYFTDDKVANGYTEKKTIPVPPKAVYVRTTLYSEGSTLGTNTVKFSCEALFADDSDDSDDSVNDSVGGTSNVSTFDNIEYPNYTIIPVPHYPHHDVTFVDDNIWAFDKASQGGMKMYNKDFQQIGSANTRFYFNKKEGGTAELEMKSVDFNNHNRVLLVGNGSARYTKGDSFLYLFYECEKWPSQGGTINFNNCGAYTEIDVSDLGDKCYAFWNSSCGLDDQIFVQLNLFKDVYLVRLGKGTNKLQQGVYKYLAPDKYNGTYQVLNHWTQRNCVTGEFGQHGGQFYKGSLYLVNNDSNTNQIYKCKLKANGSLKFDVLEIAHYMDNGQMQYRYIDGFCIKDGYGYGAPLYIDGKYNGSSNKVVLKIEID